MLQRLILMIAVCLILPGQSQANLNTEPWILVDTSRQAISVMVGNEVRETFHGISVGRGGTAELHLRGDGRTPKGNFRIAWVNTSSKYHRFFGLDYPNIDQAEQAYRAEMIDFDTYYQISQAVLRGQTPPQDTPLGGYIGIHGLGGHSMRVHETLNWTEGCIALTNAQIDHLARWLGVGTRVVII